MAEEHGIFIKGKSNGTTSYQDKQGKFYYSVLIIIPGSETNMKIGLNPQSDPQKFNNGVDVAMKVVPRFFQGKFTGFNEVTR